MFESRLFIKDKKLLQTYFQATGRLKNKLRIHDNKKPPQMVNDKEAMIKIEPL